MDAALGVYLLQQHSWFKSGCKEGACFLVAVRCGKIDEEPEHSAE
jgi:hypothetical protein